MVRAYLSAAASAPLFEGEEGDGIGDAMGESDMAKARISVALLDDVTGVDFRNNEQGKDEAE